jgi:hypothetical protein
MTHSQNNTNIILLCFYFVERENILNSCNNLIFKDLKFAFSSVVGVRNCGQTLKYSHISNPAISTPTTHSIGGGWCREMLNFTFVFIILILSAFF